MESISLNPAMQVYVQCGLSVAHFGNSAVQRNASSTKAGPGRRRENGDGSRTTEQKRAGAYGRGLRNWLKGKVSKGRI